MGDDDDGFGDYESGPFCRHWSDPSDCDIVCECGHRCARHEQDKPGACYEDGCLCEEWREMDETERLVQEQE